MAMFGTYQRLTKHPIRYQLQLNSISVDVLTSLFQYVIRAFLGQVNIIAQTTDKILKERHFHFSCNDKCRFFEDFIGQNVILDNRKENPLGHRSWHYTNFFKGYIGTQYWFDEDLQKLD